MMRLLLVLVFVLVLMLVLMLMLVELGFTVLWIFQMGSKIFSYSQSSPG